MVSYKYTIEGKLSDNSIDITEEISKLASSSNISIELNNTKLGLTIVSVGEELQIADFESQLFRKLALIFNITKYTKKDVKEKKKPLKIKKKDELKDKKDYSEKDIKLVAKLLRQSKIVAIKQSNGFHIICNASQLKAIQTLREIIKQPDKPLSVIFRSMQKLKQQIILSKKESELIESSSYPIVIAKLKNLHRLEKPKYSLSPTINSINNRIQVSLTDNDFYKNLFNIIDFPIVSIDALEEDSKIIFQKDKLLEFFGDNFAFIFEPELKIDNPHIRKIIQIAYGKQQLIQFNKNTICACSTNEPSLCVQLDNKYSTFSSSKKDILKFKSYKLLLNSKGEEEPKYTALSLLFSKLSLEKTLGLDLPFTLDEISKLYEAWNNSINTHYSNSVILLFDGVASLSGELHQKSFETQSILLSESHFEVCEEDLFDFEIADKEIEIDIVSTFLETKILKKLCSKLVCTISFIIAKVASEQNLSVVLCGEIFQYRDLVELTIEQLEEEELQVHFT